MPNSASTRGQLGRTPNENRPDHVIGDRQNNEPKAHDPDCRTHSPMDQQKDRCEHEHEGSTEGDHRGYGGQQAQQNSMGHARHPVSDSEKQSLS